METYKVLEREFAEWTNYKQAVALNSGTSALHIALLAMGIGEGDEVIVPDFTFASCAFAVSYCGAKPVFVDCDDTLNINVKKIEEKITTRTKAIMAVHIYGRKCNMREIERIAKVYKLYILEDLSEAHGIQPSGDIAIYSFQATKIIHAEEGGMLVTDNPYWAEEIRLRKTLANNGDYFHPMIGFNYRMPNSQAELALKSFRDVDKNLKKRREWEKKMIEKYGDDRPERDVVWVFDTFKDVEEPTRPFFKPLSSLPMYGGVSQSQFALYYSLLGKCIKYEALSDRGR